MTIGLQLADCTTRVLFQLAAATPFSSYTSQPLPPPSRGPYLIHLRRCVESTARLMRTILYVGQEVEAILLLAHLEHFAFLQPRKPTAFIRTWEVEKRSVCMYTHLTYIAHSVCLCVCLSACAFTQKLHFSTNQAQNFAHSATYALVRST